MLAFDVDFCTTAHLSPHRIFEVGLAARVINGGAALVLARRVVVLREVYAEGGLGLLAELTTAHDGQQRRLAHAGRA